MAASVAAHQRTPQLIRQLSDPLAAGEYGGCRTEQARGRARRVLAHAVTGRNVADLVSQYSRELLFAVHIRNDSAGDIDEAARQSKRIDFRAVQQRELKIQIAAVAIVLASS